MLSRALLSVLTSISVAVHTPPSTHTDSLTKDRVALRQIADEALRVWRDSSARGPWNTSAATRRHTIELREDDWSVRLARIDGDRLYGSDDWRLYGTLRTAVESTREKRVCHEEWWNVDQIFGWQAQAIFQSATAPLATAQQRARLINWYRQLPNASDEQIADLGAGMVNGYTAPRAMVLRVIDQLSEALADTSRTSDLMMAARRDSSPAFANEWKTTIDTYAKPALMRYRDFLANTYLQAAREEIGIAALPNGRECYRAELYSQTGVKTDPDSLYAAAVTGLADIHTTMRSLAERVVGTTDIVAAMRALRSEPRFVEHDADASLAAYRAQVARAELLLAKWFTRVPYEPLAVTPIPRAQAPTFPPAKYVQSPGDGSAPAQLMANVYQPSGVSRMNIALGVAHEGLPGHHFQFLYGRSGNIAHPIMRMIGNWSLANGFREGWAIYSEGLAAEMGEYVTPLDSIGYLTHMDDVFTGLRTDIGIHYYGWSREQAIDTMMVAAGRPRVQAESYADRHASSAGQLASYGIGYFAFARLRSDAERKLKDRFDIKAFHDQLLDEGPMPVPLLSTKIDRWIAHSSIK